jgi:hypothetical protein
MIVPVELDLQQASKVADEKRKRNAGASARFRARRKEKEKEASQTISGLQQELRDLMEERDFYREERNYCRNIATRHVPPTQLPKRPLSPRQRRRAAAAAAPAPPIATSTSTDYQSGPEDYYPEETGSGPPHQQPGGHRMVEYPPGFVGRQPPLSPPGLPYGVPYQPQPQPPVPLQPPAGGYESTPRSLPPGAASAPSSIARSSQSYDPFRTDLFDRTTWGGGR